LQCGHAQPIHVGECFVDRSIGIHGNGIFVLKVGERMECRIASLEMGAVIRNGSHISEADQRTRAGTTNAVSMTKSPRNVKCLEQHPSYVDSVERYFVPPESFIAFGQRDEAKASDDSSNPKLLVF
jgi:hypothetical protein